MTQPDLFAYEPQPLQPVNTPTGLGKPTYTPLKVKTPQQCHACQIHALHTLKTGEPLQPIRLAHWRRSQRGAETLPLCYEHKTLMAEADGLNDYASNTKTPKKGRVTA